MKSNNPFTIRITIFFLVLFFVIGGLYFWWLDGISAVDSNITTPVTFVIEKGDGVKAIVSRLAQMNLIRSPTAFYILVKLQKIEKKLEAGDYRLNKSMDAKTIAKELTHGMQDVWLTTLEGWRVEEIATKLAKDLDIPENEFLKYATEGYMFPDTYSIPREATAAAIAEIFKDNFQKKVTPEMITSIKNHGLTLGDVITLASIVEREGKNTTDKPIIAGILFNRLKAKQSLQVDATLQYALAFQATEKTWWKKELTEDDKKIQSPYNTYINVGLPPKPISNPGIDAIMAVINPAASDYYYYLHDEKGIAHYAKTLDEHNANITKYLHY
jgi:UPF0755 protein